MGYTDRFLSLGRTSVHMSEQTDVRRLLVLHGPAWEAEGLLGFFGEHFDLHVTQDLSGALDALRSSPFDAVLAETGDFLPLERGVVTQQAAAILDTLGEGVGVVGPGGEMVWANRRLREFGADVQDSLCAVCRRAFGEFAAAGGGPSRGVRTALMPADGRYYEVICNAICDREQSVRQVAAVVVDATSQRRQQLKLNAIERAGRALVELDYDAIGKLNASGRLALLEERIIHSAREVLDYEHLAVLLLDEKTNKLDIVIAEGLSDGVLGYDLFARTEGNGLCGYVAATGRSYICQDVQQDARYLPGVEDARSSLTVPLKLADRVVGVLNVESDWVGRFGEEDRQFAEIFANHVAMALHVLNLLVSERHTTHTQVGECVAAELAGPLNDIITQAGELREDYIGHDDLRRRLADLIDLAAEAQRSVRQWSHPGQSALLGSASTPTRPDAVLAGRRVLVADDEQALRETIADVLRPQGCVVDLAADGVDAMARIDSEDYDLVLSDIKMPGATGYEVFAHVRERRPQTAVILTTAFGYDPHHSIVRANQEGLSAVLYKPFKAEELLDRCREAVQAGPAA